MDVAEQAFPIDATNHLDLDSINALNIALQRYEGTALPVTRDHDGIDEVASRIWNFVDGAIENFKAPTRRFAPPPKRLPRLALPVRKRERVKRRRPPKTDLQTFSGTVNGFRYPRGSSRSIAFASVSPIATCFSGSK